MSAPTPRSTFAQRLDWLLTVVPAQPAAGDRTFTIEDLVVRLARVALSGGSPDQSTGQARQWLANARAEGVRSPADWASARFLAALEDAFRLPLGYFTDSGLATSTDQRIRFAIEARTAGLQFTGPCRVSRAEVPTEQIHVLHVAVAAELRRRAAPRTGPI